MAEATPSRGGTLPRIDQTVHGYDRGHRLLTASRSLNDAADQLLGSMSDLLTTQLLDGGSSYLVGYPLKSQNAYVVAKTWAATEMPRPGSVWTHSLIVDYQTLATLEDPGRLLALFRRPDLRTIDSFSDPITVVPDSSEAPLAPSAGAARAAIASLYARNTERNTILPSTTQTSDEQLVLRLWRQMWPALRRDTAFFGFAEEPPSTVDASCIISFSRSQRTSTEVKRSDGVAAEVLVTDLPHPNQTPIRAFLARHAFDAPEPRAAVFPLVGLWQAMTRPDQDGVICALVDTLPYVNAGRLTRSVLGQLFDGALSGSPLLEVVEHFGNLEYAIGTSFLTPSKSWETPADLGILLDRCARYADGTLAAAIFQTVAETAPIENLARTNLTESTSTRLLKTRPELLDHPAFWEVHRTTQSLLIRKAAALGRPTQAVLALVHNKLDAESVIALFQGWPDEVGTLIGALTRLPGNNRLVGAALGRSEGMLQLALDSGAPLAPNLLEEAALAAFQHASLTFPPSDLWRRLASRGCDENCPNLMVLSFVDLLERGTAGRQGIARLFMPLNQLVVRNALTYEARRYLEKALQSLGVYRWSMSAALIEVLITTFLEGRSVGTEILGAVGRGEIAGLVDALHARLGLDAVSDLLWRARHSGDRLDAWQIRFLEDFVRRREKRWFW